MSNVFIAFQKNEETRAIVAAILADNPHAVASDQPAMAGGCTISRPWAVVSWPCTRRHRLVPLKKPRVASSQAVRTDVS